MSKVDIKQLIKILNLTQSDNDNEALSAIRTANKLMKRNDANWEQVLSAEASVTINPIIQHKKNSYRMCPTEVDGDFLFTAGRYQPWLNDLTEEGKRIVTNIVNNARKEGKIANITWGIFAHGWNAWAKRENER